METLPKSPKVGLEVQRCCCLTPRLNDPLCIVFAIGSCCLGNLVKEAEEPKRCGLPRGAYVDGTSGLKWYKSRCLVTGTLLRRHKVAPIELAIAATECKILKNTFYDEFEFECILGFPIAV